MVRASCGSGIRGGLVRMGTDDAPIRARPNFNARRFRVFAIVLVGIILSTVMFVAIWNSGYPSGRNRLLSGTVWLSSAQVGQLTLLDGSSAEVAARVEVTTPHSDLQVVQARAAAYAVNRSEGSVRRVDDATFAVTTPSAPIPGARQGLKAFASLEALYVLDTQRGLVTDTDPATVKSRRQLSLPAGRIDDDAVVIDDAGRLWVLDISTGSLTWILNEEHRNQQKINPPGPAMLAVANGRPILIDLHARTAAMLNPNTAATTQTTQLYWHADDRVRISGSPHANRLYVTAPRGAFAICNLEAPSCDEAEPLASANADLGLPVEAEERVFVPDYDSGQVWILDLHRNIVAQPQVVPSSTRFQLVAHDGIVFYNDPNSEQAGVIRADGTVLPVTKYDPKNPDKDLTDPTDAINATENTTPPPAQPKPTSPTPTISSASPSSRPQTPTQISPGHPSLLQITTSNLRPLINEEVTLEVTTTSGPKPGIAHWTFGDGTETNQLRTTHRWTTARTYQVHVDSTLTNGQTATAFISIQVVTDTGPNLTILPPSGGAITDGIYLLCNPSCSHEYAPGDRVTLTAQPAPGYEFDSWNGSCTGTNLNCTLLMDIDKQVSATFRPLRLPPPNLLNPPDGSLFVGFSYQTALDWATVIDAARYQVEVECFSCSTPDVWTPQANTTTTASNHNFTWLGDYNGRWRITAIDANGTSGTPSTWWHFTYQPPLPAPIQISPGDGAIFPLPFSPGIVNWRILADWEPVPSADHYYLEVECLGCIVANEWTSHYSKSTNLTEDRFLPRLNHYHRWRVTAVTANNIRGINSPWRQFYVYVES